MANLGFIEGWNARVKLQTQSTDPPNILTTKKYVDDIKAAFDTFVAAIPTANIVTSASARFVTDAEKTAWNGKASTALATTSANGLMSSTDKTKLDRVPSLSAANVFSTGFTVTGDLSVTGNILYDLSDVRLKTQFESIEDPISKILSLDTGFYYYNDIAKKYGFNNPTRQIGLKAQQVQAIIPEAVFLAPFDNDNGVSKSGEEYLTIRYEKLVPLLIEALKAQQKEINLLKEKVGV
jgi:hypothetical protein